MVRILIILAVIWIILMPPLFTAGACTAEYEAASALVESKGAIASSDLATKFFQDRSIPVALISVASCNKVKPRFLDYCGSGPLVYAQVPVSNQVCRFYRDSATRIRLQYDDKDRLSQVITEMDPFKSLPLPWGGTLHWAR